MIADMCVPVNLRTLDYKWVLRTYKYQVIKNTKLKQQQQKSQNKMSYAVLNQPGQSLVKSPTQLELPASRSNS